MNILPEMFSFFHHSIALNNTLSEQKFTFSKRGTSEYSFKFFSSKFPFTIVFNAASLMSLQYLTIKIPFLLFIQTKKYHENM